MQLHSCLAIFHDGSAGGAVETNIHKDDAGARQPVTAAEEDMINELTDKDQALFEAAQSVFDQTVLDFERRYEFQLCR